MSASDNAKHLFRQDVYERTFSEIRTLKRNLPEDVVVSLAKEVVARLSAHFDGESDVAAAITDEQVEELAHALISSDKNAAANLVTTKRMTGASIKTLYLSYLGAAARRLGEWWETDQVTFIQVLTGTGRIYAIMRGLKPLFADNDVTLPSKSALFIAVPGEEHVLGVQMAADLIRAEGWSVDLDISQSHDSLIELISHSDHRYIGLSAAGIHSVAHLAKLIVAIRLWAPHALILVSGNIVATAEDTVRLMGPDAMATEFDSARDALERLWAEDAAAARSS
ncbi:cobalamin-dependent protein [uncultured Litoreibacter sp.]|uniref:cobalamin B12-binding domain-containing protein n=1 Tax=uncultured Litoreibacter sp. TaxID=1392394 RepID=UPI002628138B|nr:cobalamin-dependent protein [uncultured Litoreibacter sp.]